VQGREPLQGPREDPLHLIAIRHVGRHDHHLRAQLPTLASRSCGDASVRPGWRRRGLTPPPR
jgi:hypothetical protein